MESARYGFWGGSSGSTNRADWDVGCSFASAAVAGITGASSSSLQAVSNGIVSANNVKNMIPALLINMITP
ncbi:MAG: hypothetical protein HOC20_00050 [Chloroflexi bacterium]|jgi:hypothetical protein|nr:hypothetical protein [Chloroflexota bacterium]